MTTRPTVDLTIASLEEVPHNSFAEADVRTSLVHDVECKREPRVRLWRVFPRLMLISARTDDGYTTKVRN